MRRILVAAVLGLIVGGLTSLLQTVADYPWLALVNAASPWLTTAFVAGSLQRTPVMAAVGGVLATLLEIGGYYVTADLRGFGISTSNVLLWTGAAVIGGPVFGLAGRAWRRAEPSGVGAALLVGAFTSEAIVLYLWILGYGSSAVLFGVIAVGLLAGLGQHAGQMRKAALWAIPATALGVAGNAVVWSLLG